MTTKKRDPRSMIVLRCEQTYGLKLRAHLMTVFGAQVRGMFTPIEDSKLFTLRLGFPESIADSVIHSATSWIEKRMPDGKELVSQERGRR